MNDDVQILLDSIYNKVSGDIDKKIEKLKIIATTLIADGDLSQDDLDKYITLSDIQNDKVAMFILNKISFDTIYTTFELIYEYYSKFLDEQDIMDRLDIIRTHILSHNNDPSVDIDKALFKLMSESTDESVATPAKMKWIKIMRETKEAKAKLFDTSGGHYGFPSGSGNGCGGSSSSNRRSSC